MNRTWLAAVLLAIAVLMAGCGGPDAGPGDNETVTETPFVEETPGEETPGVAETPTEETDVALPGAPDVGHLAAVG